MGAANITAQTGGNFAITQSVVAGGGQNSAGGTFAVDGTIGQTFAGQTSNSGAFKLQSGFWTSFPSPKAPFDFDGDGKSDISVFRPSNGTWYLQQSTAGFTGTAFGTNGDKITPADYDGDGKTDIAVWRESGGVFYIINSSDNSIRGERFGLPGDIPAVGDWDGDGKSDIAVYRDSAVGNQNYFYYRGSLANPDLNITYLAWGTSGDKPVAADFDGDGKLDPGVFRPSDRTWYISQSSNTQFIAVQFGLSTDTPVPADYDGDGKTDIAVFRPSDGAWYLLQSTAGFAGTLFGTSGDLPTAADYDGDGKADIAVFRAGTWYLLQTTAGFTGVAFGSATDKPVPSAFVP